MKLLPYSEGYKESATVWASWLPSHWQCKRLGSLLKERGEVNRDYREENVLSVLRDIGVIPYADKGNVGNKKSEDIARYKIVRPNDLVLNSMNVIIGSVGRSRYPGCLSPVYYVLMPRSSELTPEFAESIFQVKPFQQSLIRIGYGILAHRMRIPMELLKSEALPVPPLAEQEQIVRFVRQLDSRVNRLIKAKRRLIELLNEQKQAIIHQAVTRGLDPTAPLKPSGIDWLGDIPAHWDVKPLLACFGEVQKKNERLIETNVLSLSYGELKRKDIDESKGLVPASYETWQIVEANSTVLRLTDLQNDQRSLRVAYATERGIVSSAYLHLVPKVPDVGRYLSLVLSAYDFNKAFYSLGGGCRQGIGLSELKWLPIPIPSVSEADEILWSIDAKLRVVESSKDRLGTEISLLSEYRTRLVADVVTGQLDVRQHPWANSEIEDATEANLDDVELEDDLEETDDVLEEAGV